MVEEDGLLGAAETGAFSELLEAAYQTHKQHERQRWFSLLLLGGCTIAFTAAMEWEDSAANQIAADEAYVLTAASMTPAYGEQTYWGSDASPQLAETNLHESFIGGEEASSPTWSRNSLSAGGPAYNDSMMALGEDELAQAVFWATIHDGVLYLGLGALASLMIWMWVRSQTKRGVENHQQCATMRNNEGVQLLGQGDLERAREAFSEALQLDSQLTNAWYNRGQANIHLGNFADAERDLTQAIELAPHYQDAIASRGIARIQDGDREGGIADLERVLAEEPTNLVALEGMASLHQSEQDFGAEIELWSQAIGHEQEQGQFFRQRGLAFHFSGDYSKAINDAERAIALDGHDAIAMNNLAAAKIEKADFLSAREVLGTAIKIAPELPFAYRQLARIQSSCPIDDLRDAEHAIANAEKALTIVNWQCGDWIDVLAAGYAEAGDFATAIEWQARYLDWLKDGRPIASPKDREQLLETAQQVLTQFEDGRAFRLQLESATPTVPS